MAANTKRWRLNNFSGGIDRSDGRVTDEQNRMFELTNYRVKGVKQIVRRPPNRNPGAINTCQGLITHRGTLYTVAQKATTPVIPAIPGQAVEILYFDLPDYCTSGSWTLLELKAFNGSVVALIRHAFTGTNILFRDFLHVFDSKPFKPTYVEDPACPTNWNPEFPLHITGVGAAGSYSSYRPRMTVVGSRLIISRPDGDSAFSKTSNARVWNERTVDDLVSQGEMYYFLMPAGIGLREFIVSEDFATLAAEPGWSAYVLEYLDNTGRWKVMVEAPSSTPAGEKQWRPVTVASRFTGGPAEIKIQIYWDTANALTMASDTAPFIRLRLIAGAAPTRIVSGLGVQAVDDYDQFAGTGSLTVFNSLKFSEVGQTGLGALSTLFKVYVNGTLKTYTTDYTLSYALNSTLKITMVRLTFGAAPAADADIIMVLADWVNTYLATPQPKLDTVAPRVIGGVMTREGQAVQVYATRSAITASALSAVKYALTIQMQTVNDSLSGSDINPFATPLLQVWAYTPGTHFLTGYERYYRAITKVGTWDTTTLIFPSLVAYDYGVITGSESPFFLKRQTSYQIELAGADDAGVLPTAAQASAGGAIVTALSAVKDRLLVVYETGGQVWLMPPDTAQHRIVDSGAIGTGAQVVAWPQLVDGVVILSMANGMRGQGLAGMQLESLRDQNLGDGILQLGYPQQQDATYWPKLGIFISAVTIDDVVQFLALELSTEKKIRAWERWTVAEQPMVEQCSMAVLQSRLYYRAGGELFYFDEADTDSIDDTDGDEPFESFVKWHFNDLKEPYRLKQAVLAEAAHIGRGFLEVFQDAEHPDQGNGEVLMPDTINGRKVPVVGLGHSLTVSMRSTDRTGHTIEEIGLHYRTLGRG